MHYMQPGTLNVREVTLKQSSVSDYAPRLAGCCSGVASAGKMLGRFQGRQLQLKTSRVIGLNAALLPGFKEVPQSFVPERFDHAPEVADSRSVRGRLHRGDQFRRP